MKILIAVALLTFIALSAVAHAATTRCTTQCYGNTCYTTCR